MKQPLLSSLLFAALLTAASCSSDNENIDPTPSQQQYAEVNSGKFILAVNSLQNGDEFTLQAPAIEGKTFHIDQNFMEMPSKYYTWLFRKNKAVALSYQQDNPGLGYALTLGADGKANKVGEFVVRSRFTNYEFLDDSTFVTSVGGQVSADNLRNDGATFEFWNFDNNKMNLIARKTIWTQEITGNDEQITFSGIVPDGKGNFFSAMVKSDFRERNSINGGSSVGNVSHPDSCWVALLDRDLNVKRIYADDRISYAAGQFRAMMFRSLLAADDGTVYAFSNAFNAKSTRKAGVIRILPGAETFDPDFYFDLQTPAGGYKFRRVWHVGSDRFLLEIYNDKTVSSMGAAHQFAIVDMSEKSFQPVKNLPPMHSIVSGSESGGVPAFANGVIYMPISVSGKDAQIYKIDPITAEAQPITTIIGAKELRSIGVLQP